MTHSIQIWNMNKIPFTFPHGKCSVNFLCLPRVFERQMIVNILDEKVKKWYLKLSNKSAEALKSQIRAS